LDQVGVGQHLDKLWRHQLHLLGAFETLNEELQIWV
jgi:hypothetical protein